MATLDALIQQLIASQSSAKQANLARYRQGLKTLRAGYTTAARTARRFGTAALQDVEESAVQGKATTEQDLISRGLGGTTIRGAMVRGIERQRVRERSRIGEQRALLQGQIAQQRARDIAGFIERRSDIGPDLGLFTNLLATAGQQQAIAGTPQATITTMGANALAGRTATGQPFRYTGGSLFDEGGDGGGAVAQPAADTYTGPIGGGFDASKGKVVTSQTAAPTGASEDDEEMVIANWEYADSAQRAYLRSKYGPGKSGLVPKSLNYLSSWFGTNQ